MRNRPTPAGGSDSDYFRKQAYLQDSEALSEDIVRSIVGSDAFKDLRGLLGTTVEQALRKAVMDSLKDPEIQRTIREQVATTVIAGLKKEIHDKQAEILANARRLLPTWEDNVAQAVVHDQLRSHQASGAEGQNPLEEEMSSIPREPGPRRVEPRKPLPSWLKPTAAAVGVVLALMVGLFLGKAFSSRSEPRQESRDAGAGVSKREEPVREAEMEESPQEKLFVARMKIPEGTVENDSALMAELRTHSYEDQFRCWFDEKARQRLDDLIDDPGLDRVAFEKTLEDAFAPCVATDYPMGTSKLPVFAAQGLVGYLLKREEEDGWDLCAEGQKPSALPDLATVTSDGEPGRTTYSLLNGFLACIDRSSQLKIDANSTSEEYLFTVYAALKELERR